MSPRIASLSIAALLAGGCAQRAYFQPTENATAVGHGGQPAAAYDVRPSAGSEPTVHVNVWSRGAYQSSGQTFVRLALEIRNTGSEPVTLDRGQLVLDTYGASGQPLGSFRPVQITSDSGSLAVPPGATTTGEAIFALPGGVTPDALASLRLRWALALDNGERYVQYTEFGRTPTYALSGGVDYVYHPVFGYYDPFFYGPPYAWHLWYHVPVGRVVVHDHRTRWR